MLTAIGIVLIAGVVAPMITDAIREYNKDRDN
jgi:hypothetical protein